MAAELGRPLARDGAMKRLVNGLAGQRPLPLLATVQVATAPL